MSGHIDYESLPAPGRWAERAACKGWTESFFTREVTVIARRLCASCPVDVECLRYALDNNVQGTWAGTSWADRQRRRRRRIA